LTRWAGHRLPDALVGCQGGAQGLHSQLHVRVTPPTRPALAYWPTDQAALHGLLGKIRDLGPPLAVRGFGPDRHPTRRQGCSNLAVADNVQATIRQDEPGVVIVTDQAAR
jgi:hypothetical protein